MKIAEKNDLIRTDVEGMIKLKDELANSRVEILRENRFQKPLEIADRHWNDYHKPILEVIGFARQSRAVERPMDADIEIIDIIGAERAKQIYPDLLANAPKHKSTPIGGPSTSYWRPGASHSNVDLRHELREREGNVSHSGDQKKVDEQLRITGLKTSLMLAEEKAQTFDRKNRELESELKKVYQHLLKVNAEKKQLLRKCDTLEAQLDRAFGQSSVASTSVAPKRKIVPKRQFVDFPDQRYLAVKSRKLKDYVVTKTRQKYRRIARIGRKRVAYGGAQSSMASTSAPKRALNVERYPADRPPKLRGYGFTNYNRNGANYERRPEPQEPYEDDGLYETGNYRALYMEEFDRIQ
ncbi:unnamed protein product [Oppiella nova]|uniref:Uncharacterized protein n=1 Tax=Oppiella nova TaxID=334625 RepID=A0A7R9QXD1_9ACAR|nr:unnamed protein product [Oppiella nova]CAG2177556.1 unnamed protein product [Oppiella nova]